MYDWANSAYITTVTVAALPIYFNKVIVPESGFRIFGYVYSADSLWAFMISLSAFLAFAFAPVLGAISDFSSSKKKFLMAFCYTGSLFAVLLFFSGSGDVWRTIIFFVIAQAAFVGGNVFYDAFLPQIASEDKLDWVSGKGFAFGYIGGGIQFGLSLGLIVGHNTLGISQELAIRIAILTAGIWWAGFATVSFRYLKEPQLVGQISDGYKSQKSLSWWAYARIGVERTWETTKQVRKFKSVVLFLIAFMIYNDGIQTVISVATMYGSSELNFSSATLMTTLLIIQIIAFFGALIFGKLAEKITAKKALMTTLVLWSGVVVYAYFMTSPAEYYALGVVVGMVLGGSQALSRSLYGSMIPVHSSAQFYGFYSIFSKFSAIWGPLAFGLISHITGTSRTAIISLIIFFIIGLILLYFVDTEKGKALRNAEL